jgi:hypothetical protein
VKKLLLLLGLGGAGVAVWWTRYRTKPTLPTKPTVPTKPTIAAKPTVSDRPASVPTVPDPAEGSA